MSGGSEIAYRSPPHWHPPSSGSMTMSPPWSEGFGSRATLYAGGVAGRAGHGRLGRSAVLEFVLTHHSATLCLLAAALLGASPSYAESTTSEAEAAPIEPSLELALHALPPGIRTAIPEEKPDRKSTRLNSSHSQISYAVFCLKKKKKK